MAPKREQILWENMWATAERLEQVFSLKAIVSAGVVLFDKLSGDEQKQAITEANRANKEAIPLPLETPNISQSIEDVTYYVKFKLPSPEEQKKLSELRKMLGPEPKKRKKKTKIS